jgi:2-polyprenyl-6-hydroxyphenyl methylase/3-demethylubiquinone-9 3-methyltransferase
VDSVDNSIYDRLGERWYTAEDDPVALLRAEARWRNPWVSQVIEERLGPGPRRVLDIGCGAGFLSNFLAGRGHDVTGLDSSAESLAVARTRDTTGAARYLEGDALRISLDSGVFDAVCAMDFLEHVDRPDLAIAEAARMLRPGGLFFFYTFNRNPLSWLIAIKGVEWFVRNTPPRLHQLSLFIKPKELACYCRRSGLEPRETFGARPDFGRTAFWRMLVTGRVGSDFAFRGTRSTLLAYCGYAEKTA